MNKAMTTIGETVGQDVPSLEEVRDKIEARYARALGSSELQGQTVEHRMLEVEQAQMNDEAQARLEQIREQLGLSPGPSASGELSAGSNSGPEITSGTQSTTPAAGDGS
jgi:phage shock protein A